MTPFPLGIYRGSVPLGSLSHPLRLGSLSVEQRLSQSSVFCTLQDRRGFLWFGTEDGLNRYDGYSFRIFRPDVKDPRSISGNFILSLAEDPRGRIWVGTISGLNLMNVSTGRSPTNALSCRARSLMPTA